MTIADVISKDHDLKVFSILENAQKIPTAGALPEQYDIKILRLCIERRYIFDAGSFYKISDSGSSLHWLLAGKLFAVRSASNNVFKYDSYWGSWSRVLWHESDKNLKINLGLEVRSSSMIELDLTAVNIGDRYNWERKVQHANIRVHSTSIDPKDKLVGTLPGHVVYTMRKWLTDDAVDKLLHADYLSFTDFEKGRNVCNGGFKFADACKEFMSIDRYTALLRRQGAGPGLLLGDVREDYEDEKKFWDAKRDALIITKGMRDGKE